MKSYRLYFLDGANHIQAAHGIEVEDEEDALWIAERLFDACPDVSAAFELWHEARTLERASRVARLRDKAGGFARARHEILVRHEEALRDSAFRVAKSRRLLDKL